MSSGPLMFLGSSGLISGLFSFVVAKLESEELNNFWTVVLSAFFVSSERASGNPVTLRLRTGAIERTEAPWRHWHSGASIDRNTPRERGYLCSPSD